MNRIVAVTASAALALSPLALTAPSYAAPARADSWTVTATISDTVAIGKETILKVRGRVTPKAAGQKVVLQQRVGTKKAWKATGSAKVKRNGTYLLKDMPSTAGTRSYRVLKPASNGLRKGLSKPIEVDVYRWGKLTMRPVGPSENLIPDHVYIGTDYYSRSLVNTEAGVPASIEFTLGRKCLELRATYALTDEAASGSSGAITVSTDGAVRTTHSLPVGTIVEDDTLDVSDAFRVKFDVSTTATPAAYAAVATPEVLCTR